ncbi:class I SAM-dependent methyltransferase [Thalassobellus sediminis]|uniref:class I SAM-dependent methyltransferase n=1 Tax=Thalassobellus sediminis TaxID=3367753 RepID=UPI00379C623E
MYKTIKNSLKALIPKSFLFKNELFFRKFHGAFYLGKNHQCNTCDKQLKSFITLENKDLLCPFCGSLSRNRRLWQLLNDNDSINGNILHFSPSRSLYRNFKKEKSITYYSSDFEDEFLADYKFDITNIEQENEKFDTIICYHILEHIIEDKKAMSELYRVLNPNGTIFIQTPFKEGDIYEDFSIITPEDREKHFGQNDHVRIYSVGGLKERLENIGFKVQIENFDKHSDDLFVGFKSPETVLIAKK